MVRGPICTLLKYFPSREPVGKICRTSPMKGPIFPLELVVDVVYTVRHLVPVSARSCTAFSLSSSATFWWIPSRSSSDLPHLKLPLRHTEDDNRDANLQAVCRSSNFPSETLRMITAMQISKLYVACGCPEGSYCCCLYTALPQALLEEFVFNPWLHVMPRLGHDGER